MPKFSRLLIGQRRWTGGFCLWLFLRDSGAQAISIPAFTIVEAEWKDVVSYILGLNIFLSRRDPHHVFSHFLGQTVTRLCLRSSAWWNTSQRVSRRESNIGHSHTYHACLLLLSTPLSGPKHGFSRCCWEGWMGGWVNAEVESVFSISSGVMVSERSTPAAEAGGHIACVPLGDPETLVPVSSSKQIKNTPSIKNKSKKLQN